MEVRRRRMENIFTYILKLRDVFGWWSLAIVSAVFLLMLPLNRCICAIFKRIAARLGASDSLERVRKTASSLTVFLLSAAAVAVFCALFLRVHDLVFVFINAVPVGVCAMLIRAIYKLIRDNGVMPIVRAIARASTKFLSDVPIPHKLKCVISARIKDFLCEGDFTGERESALIASLKKQLDGFVDDTERYAVRIASIVAKNQKTK